MLPPIAAAERIVDIDRGEVVGEDLPIRSFRGRDASRRDELRKIEVELVALLRGGGLLTLLILARRIRASENDHIRFVDGRIARSKKSRLSNTSFNVRTLLS